MKDILDGLNKEQVQAVTTVAGQLLVIAGAGTGKTTVIARRIAHIIEKKLAKPAEILALTFTDKAAQEMEERVDVLVPYGWVDTWISTFHAFGDRVLRQHCLEIGLPPDFRVMTKPEQFLFVQQNLFRFNLEYFRPLSNPTKHIQALLALVSRAKDEDVDHNQYLKFAQKIKGDRAEQEKQLELSQFFADYERFKAQAGLVDFGDLVVLTLKLFRDRPKILGQYQEKFKYILVDEYQDTNYAQNEIVKLLSSKHKNICVVGDDDQSIYKFRGAAISNILQFKRNFPKARQIVLTQNYRSSQAILDTAYRLIKHNDPDRLEVKNKINKKLRSVKQEYGQVPQELFGQTLSDETDLVAEEILKLTSQKTKTRKDQTNFKDIVILVRANSQAPAFMRSLNMRQIPHKFLGSSGLYDLEEIRNLISFLRAVSHFDDSLNLYNLAISDYYGLSIEDCIRCMDWASRKTKTLHWVFENIGKTDVEISDISQKIIRKLIADLKKYAEISRKQKVGRVLYEFLKDYGVFDRKDFSSEDQSKIQNIAKFFEKIQEFSFLAQEESVRNFTDYLEFMRTAGDDPATAEVDPDQDAVGIMTVHAAKGLEFKVVFLVNLVSERFPARDRGELIELPVDLIKEMLPVGDFHLEEERRLFYVGITRAKELIYFSWSKDYGGKRLRKISPFVLEALDRQQIDSQSIKKSSLEKITQIALSDAGPTGQLVLLDNRLVRLSQQQIDDYLTCPLKYKYASIMRIPVLKHHAVVYGAALHKAVETFYRQKMADKTMPLSDLLEVFENSWDQEGFLSAQHEELRLSQAKKVLENFWQREKSNPTTPTFIEKPFRVGFSRVQLVGRMDRVDIVDKKVKILDFKSSENVTQEQANRRARESVQLGIYALAYYKIYGQIPDSVGLYFLENGMVGDLAPDLSYLSKVEQWIKQTEQGILSGNFAAQPSYLACAFCVFNSICPFTATKV